MSFTSAACLLAHACLWEPIYKENTSQDPQHPTNLPLFIFLPLLGCSWDTACLHLYLSGRPRGCGPAVGAGCASQRGPRLSPAPVDTEPASHCRISTVCRQERHRQKGSGASLFATLREIERWELATQVVSLHPLPHPASKGSREDWARASLGLNSTGAS